MSSEHTSGPWEWWTEDDGSVSCLIGPEESACGRGVGSPVIIGAVCDEDADGEPIAVLQVRERDRSLIAAAPDLLAACVLAEPMLSAMCNALGETCSETDAETLWAVKDAIAKARGLAPPSGEGTT